MNSDNPVLRLLFVFLTVVLIAGTTVPPISSQPPQSTAIDVSQIVKQIAERVASANTGINIVFVEQILTELARQSSQVSNQGNILEEIHSQILTFPYGVESQSLARFANLLSADSSALVPLVQKILQEQSGGKSASQSIVNIAVQDATGGGRNVNNEIALAAQIIAKQSPGIPVRNIESIIIQMALEISRAQGKAITGQTIFEIASQIKQNPNGVITQAILQLAKQDTHDNGKTGQTSDTIKTIVVENKKNNDEINDPASGTDRKGRSGDVGPTDQLPPITPPGLPSGVAKTAQPKTLARSAFQLLDFFFIGLADGALKRALGDDLYARANEVIESIDPSDVQAAGTWIGGLLLQIANSGGQSELIRTLDSLHSVVESNPTLLHKMGQLTTLYQTGDAVSAADTSDIIADKIVAGIDPAIAIEETPIQQPEIVTDLPTDEMTELGIKSLPPSEPDTSISPGNGTELVELGSPVQPMRIPDAAEPGESAFIPGLGVLAPQPDSSVPPSETPTVEGRPEPITEPGASPLDRSEGGLDLSQFIPSSSGGLRISAQVECLGNLEPCTVPLVPSLSPPIDLCQEQWYLPECAQNGNEEDDLEDGNGALLQAPVYDEGGYQQLPYYYEEPGGYQEGEDQYSDDTNEENDYEGGYQEYEQDYSEEEDSGDEEDDYEEVGNYQEEEENYSEEEVEEDDSGADEDFTEEEEESGEFSEE